MRDSLEGVAMALLLLAALCVVYLLAVFILSGANPARSLEILYSLWAR